MAYVRDLELMESVRLSRIRYQMIYSYSIDSYSCNHCETQSPQLSHPTDWIYFCTTFFVILLNYMHITGDYSISFMKPNVTNILVFEV